MVSKKMESKIEPRKDFYADEMIYERMESKWQEIAKFLTLKEKFMEKYQMKGAKLSG